ncbi:MAG TPA: HAD-IA family hydrolase [Gemmataceae bacterium]|jgi:putative hydrolase of the HAD superfamily|nr:HAD-IA family hydrolase [Gemmataceae bacterium]
MRSDGFLQGVRAVVFDAVGTLLFPDPPAQAVYAEVGRRFGSRLNMDVIAARFRAAFRAEEEIDRAAGWRTDEQREERRWQTIVAATLDDVTDDDGCFGELWHHFARPNAWRCDPDAGPVIAELRRRRLAVGIASNFDKRLRTVAAGLPAIASVSPLIISSEVGWRKPGRPFFDAVARAVGCAAGDVLHVGDDHENDYIGATAAGLRSVLLAPSVPAFDPVARVADLAALLEE